MCPFVKYHLCRICASVKNKSLKLIKFSFLVILWNLLQSRFRNHYQAEIIDFNAGKTQLVLFDWSNNTGSIDVKMDGSVLEEKSSFKMLGLTFSSKLDWGSYIISIAKTTSKKIGALIRSMKSLSPEVALYLYKSTIQPCKKYCCHVWAGAPSCYLELLDKLQKRICRTVDPSLAASLEPLAHRQNVASLSLFYRYYFGRCSSELAELVPPPYSCGRSTCYSDKLDDFSVTIPR